MKLAGKFCIVFCALVMVGCAMTRSFTQGRNFDETKRHDIVKKVSTKEEVRDLLGEPMDKGLDKNNNEQWVYVYEETEGSVSTWDYSYKGDIRVKKLIVAFDEYDIVDNYVFSDVTNPLSEKPGRLR